MKLTTKESCFLTLCAYISLGAGVIILAYVIILCSIKTTFTLCHINEYIYACMKNSPGDFIGGIIGTLFTLTATIFLFITFKEQRHQFQIVQKSNFYTRFETTYFNMLGMLEKVRSSVNKNIKESHVFPNQSNLEDYYEGLRLNHDLEKNSNESLKDMDDDLTQDVLQSAMVLRCRQFYGEYFEKYVVDAGCNVGYFYRYIYNILNFVYTQTEFTDDHDKEKYLNLLQAQLSDEELALIFYDAISRYGENKDGNLYFYEILNKTHFLENIMPEVLLSRNHCYFYPKTKFKFMSKDEWNKARALVK